jgi:hypothetical protein
MKPRRSLSLISLGFVFGGWVLAQQPGAGAKKEMPPGWKLRLDRADAKREEFQFWTMPPRWHMTTGPAGIVYDPAHVARGEYSLESESFLFKPEGEMREGYGIFIGGKDLEGENQSYAYFLVRRDGRFLVKQRNGKATSDLIPWTEHAAIVKHDGTDRTAKNILSVEVMKDVVSFQVNGREVAALPRNKVPTDGQVGLRVNHHLNIHVTYLHLIPRAAAR